jgi:integral membrane protein
MTTPPAAAVRGALLRYRVMAYVVGVMLLLLVGAMLLKYVFGVIESTAIVAIGHGWLYMIYVLLALDLCFRMRWSFPRILFVVVAGTIPFLSFVAEHKVHGWVVSETTAADAARAAAAAAEPVAPPAEA